MTSRIPNALRHLATVAALSIALAAQAQTQPLDGKRFQGEFVAPGKSRGDADTLTFKDGRFRSSACDRYGYSDAAYTVTSDGGTLRFEAQTESAKYGRLRWVGTVRGDKLEATATMLREGKAPIENKVSASLKP